MSGQNNLMSGENNLAKPLKPTADFSSFEALDLRVGKVVDIQEAATKKPTYKITIDFGPPVGKKVSCGAYKNYSTQELLGKLVVAVVNFAPKKMGPETSEVLILGVANEKGETIYLTPESRVPVGASVF